MPPFSHREITIERERTNESDRSVGPRTTARARSTMTTTTMTTMMTMTDDDEMILALRSSIAGLCKLSGIDAPLEVMPRDAMRCHAMSCDCPSRASASSPASTRRSRRRSSFSTAYERRHTNGGYS